MAPTSGRTRPVRTEPQGEPSKADITRAQILLAAARLFGEKGYSASTLREVADSANRKAGSVYYHFASKEEILDEVLNTGVGIIMAAVTEALAALPPEAPFADRFRTAVHAHLRTFVVESEYITAYMRVYEHLPVAIKRRSRTMRRNYALVWNALIRDGIAAGVVDPALDVETFVSYLLGGLNRVVEWFNPQRHDLMQLTAMIADAHVNGIGRRQG